MIQKIIAPLKFQRMKHICKAVINNIPKSKCDSYFEFYPNTSLRFDDFVASKPKEKLITKHFDWAAIGNMLTFKM